MSKEVGAGGRFDIFLDSAWQNHARSRQIHSQDTLNLESIFLILKDVVSTDKL